MIEIDGSYLEGGGQIVRTALSLAAITGKSFRIYNVRRKRENPGLREQHLQAINAISILCNAKHNANLYSTEFEFYPGKISEKCELEIKVETAGSSALILSVIIPLAYSLKKAMKLKIKGGGTWNKFAPSVLYLQEVILPIIKNVGIEAELEIKKNGFYPQGGAEVEIYLEPWRKRNQLVLENLNIKKAKIISLASTHLRERKVAERQAISAFEIINKNDLKVEKEITYVDSICPGSGILISSFPTLLGSDVPGEIKKSAEKVGKEAALSFLQEVENKAAVDKHAADQLMIYLTLAGGKIKTSQITEHVKTNAHTIEKFLPVKFNFKGNYIECERE